MHTLTINRSALKTLIQSNSSLLLDKIANDIALEAKKNAPVQTGRLRDTIEIIKSVDKRVIIAQAPYSLYVELGTRYQRAVRFLRRAIISVQTKYIKG